MEYFPPQNVITFSKIQYAGGPVYTLALLGFKVALLSSYLRIGGFVRKYRLTVILVIVLCVANQLIFTFLLSFACRPVRLWRARVWGQHAQGIDGLMGRQIGREAMGSVYSREMYKHDCVVFLSRRNQPGF